MMAETNVQETAEDQALHAAIVAALRTVYDPEIPVNLYDLGLIYRLELGEDVGEGRRPLAVAMTLTAPNCPVAGTMPMMVQQALDRVAGIGPVQVALVWDPPWTKDRMSDEARLALNMY